MAEQNTFSIQSADQLFKQGQYAEAGEVFRSAASAAEKAGDVPTQVEALSMLARSYLIRSLGAEGRPFILQAGMIASPDQPTGWSRYLSVRGRFEWQDEKDNPKATRTFKEMYDYCMKHGLHERAVDAAHMVAITGSEEEKITWATKGIDAANASGNEGWLGPLWNNLGWTYSARGEHQKSLEALLKAREYHHRHSGPFQRLSADIFVGQAYRLAGNADEARRWLEPAHEQARRMLTEKPTNNGLKERLGNTHEQLGELEAAAGKTTEAIGHLKKARQLYVEAEAEKWGPEEIRRVEDRLKVLR